MLTVVCVIVTRLIVKGETDLQKRLCFERNTLSGYTFSKWTAIVFSMRIFKEPFECFIIRSGTRRGTEGRKEGKRQKDRNMGTGTGLCLSPMSLALSLWPFLVGPSVIST